jgi:HSP20 family protein
MLHNHFGMSEGRNNPWNQWSYDRNFDMGFNNQSMGSFGPNTHHTAGSLEWMSWNNLPKTDLLETKDNYEFFMEVPGYEPAKIDIILNNNVLTVKGHRTLGQAQSDSKGKETWNFVSNERQGMSFVRQFTLPECGTDTKVDATFRHGLLMISIKKSLAKNSVKVKIRTVS